MGQTGEMWVFGYGSLLWNPGFEVAETAREWHAQTVAAQKKQFGYNADYVGLLPLPSARRGVRRFALGVNHEYTTAKDMLPGITTATEWHAQTREQVDVQLAGIGFSVIEVEEEKGRWRTVPGAPLNRRINFLDTPHRISGPAAGSDRMKTADDPTGRWVLGTGANCAANSDAL